MGKYESISIKLMSPHKIPLLSYGEVENHFTLDAVTNKPIIGGLQCPRIFGPMDRMRCFCGKYKGKLKGHVCEVCGVEVGDPIVRRRRFGHISLASPVVHVWYRNIIAKLLNLPPKKLFEVILCKKYIVIEQGESEYDKCEIITYEQAKATTAAGFIAKTGGEAVKILLSQMDVKQTVEELKEHEPSRRVNARLKVCNYFIKSGIAPSWMVMDAVLVMPAALRPVFIMENGLAASADLNELYGKVIIRNNKLKRFLSYNAPELLINLQKGGLQLAVDALIQNGKTSKVTDRSGKRVLKSLSDNLKTKEGRLRKNILGKRVDFSGRSQITVGPTLKLHQCGFPVDLAINIARPFIYNELLKKRYAATLKQARRLVELKRAEVYEALENIFDEKMILLNRAPSLHRMSFQAFDPVFVEGRAIRLHPLTCSAFNADFDGDQMGVHLPLSTEAQIEARVLMSSVNNVLSPAHGGIMIAPSQDSLLGLYWMTKDFPKKRGEGMFFADRDDLIMAYQHDAVELQAKVKMRHNGEMIETTAGRALLSEILPEQIPYSVINKPMKKKDIAAMLEMCYEDAGHVATVDFADKLKNIGYKYATLSGISISTEDMTIPKEKWQIIEDANREVSQIIEQYENGNIDQMERYNKIIEIWSNASSFVQKALMDNLGCPEDAVDLSLEDKKEYREANSLYLMAESGARGNAEQMNLAAGMCGLMPKASGEILEIPVKGNLKEGLSYMEYLLLVHKGRKGRIDGPTKTPLAGYFTRRLVYAMQDVVIERYDCKTNNYINQTHLYDDNDEMLAEAADRSYGRVVALDIADENGDIIVSKGTHINKNTQVMIKKAGITEIPVRSPLTCALNKGVCAICYGYDLSRRQIAEIGDAVGIIAAQSVGEPGTQLTLRTFHSSGANAGTIKSSISAKNNGTINFINARPVINKEGNQIVTGRNGYAVLKHKNNEKARWKLPYAAILHFKDGDVVNDGDTIASWDPFNTFVISSAKGIAQYKHIIEGVTAVTEEHYGIQKIKIIAITKDAVPAIVIGEQEISIPIGAYLSVNNGDTVFVGDVIAKKTNDASKNVDITSGLPKVTSLLDLKKPVNKAILATIDGKIAINFKGNKIIITIENDVGDKVDYKTTLDSTVAVANGDYVNAGDTLIEGVIYPKDIITIFGSVKTAIYIVNEVQKIYRGQGVSIHDKHLEVLGRKMTSFVVITNSGDTGFATGDIVTKNAFFSENEKTGNKATAKELLLGLSDIALNYPLWLSAAAYESVTSVLTEASLSGKVDTLEGLTETIIVGDKIPAGTGHPHYQNTLVRQKRGRGRPKKTDRPAKQ